MSSKLNIKDFININPIIIKCDKEIINTIEFDNSTKIEKESDNIFDTSTNNIQSEKKGDKIIVKGCLFINTPLNYLLEFIGSLTNLDLSGIEIETEKNKSYKNINLLTEYVCVGTKQLVINVLNKKEIMNGSSSNYTEWYNNNLNYITKSFDYPRYDYNNLISNVEFIKYNDGYCDIISIFNSISSLDFENITLHSDSVNNFKNTPKKLYIKHNEINEINTKHIYFNQNSLNIITNIDVNDFINLEQIVVLNNGTVKLMFQIFKYLSRNEIIDNINKFINSDKFKELYTKTLIKQYTYKSDNNKFEFYRFKTSILFNDVDLKIINEIKSNIAPLMLKSRFSSNTSISLFVQQFYSYKSLYEINVNNLTSNSTVLSLLYKPEVHLTLSDNQLSVFFNKFYDYDEYTFYLKLLLYSIKYNPVNISDKLDFKSIIQRVQNIPIKQNIKQLTNTDPILFGPRDLPNSTRSYSALCQDKKERPSIISENEYKVIYAQDPKRAIKLKNQTFNKDLYLVCPYDDNSVINFHYYHNQKCIIKCAGKRNKMNQFIYCSKQLDVEDEALEKNDNTQSKIYNFTDNLFVGYLSYLPLEFINIIPNGLCINASEITNENIFKFIKINYESDFIIIEYDKDNSKINIVENTYNPKTSKYVILFIKSPNKNNLYVVINENYTPINILNYPNLLDIININRYNDNLEIIERILSTNKYSKDDTLEDYLNKISKDYQIIVIEGYIIGFLKKDILYITPKVRYITDKNVDTSLILSLIESKKIKYPKLSDISVNNGDYYCFDLENELVCGVFIKNGNYYHLLLTKTEKLNSDHYPIKYGSVSNYVHDLLKPKDIEVIDTDYLILKSYPLNFIFKQMFKKYCYDNPNNINKEDFMKYYSKILTKSPTNFKNINWRTFDLEETTINQDEFEKFISKYIINEELYYNIIQEDYNLDVLSDENLYSKSILI